MIESLTKSNVTPFEFEKRISGPLEVVLGQSLLAVSYGILDYDRDKFSAEQPNNFGVLSVRLYFEKLTIELSWGFDQSLRGGDLYYHIQVITAAEPNRIGAMTNGHYFEFTNVCSAPWQEVIGTRLTAVEVLGIQGSPQAVHLSFGNAEVVVAVGYGGEEMLVGDGDDVLVFSEQEWQHKQSIHGGAWETLWTALALY